MDWPERGDNDLVTASCDICGAIYGIAYGNRGTPTDNRDKHIEWHMRLLDLIGGRSGKWV